MRTLLFCTAYAGSEEIWTGRYRQWYDYYKTRGLHHHQLLIVDDGSPLDPDFVSEGEYVKLTPRLGRQEIHIYPGWYRSVGYALKYANQNNFEKVIHCESDAFLLSDRIVDFVNNLDSGWNTFWCTCHSLPESAIQVIGKDKLREAEEFFSHSYRVYVGCCMDDILPYTAIHKNFVGDRYQEYRPDVPEEADFCCQTNPGTIHPK